MTNFKKPALTLLIIASSFYMGFAFNQYSQPGKNETPTLKRVTGIGGIFFKCKDPKQLRQWYSRHLGLNTNDYGSVFEWRQGTDTTKKGFTQWSPFSQTTKYFGSAEQQYMINYRVADLEALVVQLRKEGVVVADSIQRVDYGKFVHIIDGEGNKVELWEPNDEAFEELGKKLGSKTTK